MQDYWKTRQPLFYFFKNVKSELRLLTGLELERAVARAYGNCKRIDAGAADKLLNFLGPCIAAVLCGDVYSILNAGESAKLAFNDHTPVVGVFHNAFCHGDIVLERML